MEYRLVLDQSVIDEYSVRYFKLHPRAKKKPIEKPYQPSLNQLLVWSRMQRANEKAKWKEFGVWWIKELGLNDIGLEKFEIETIIYFDSKRRHDIDNFCNNKLILDSFTESGFIVDDDSEHLVKAIASIRYDKENPRTEFIVTEIEEGSDAVVERECD